MLTFSWLQNHSPEDPERQRVHTRSHSGEVRVQRHCFGDAAPDLKRGNQGELIRGRGVGTDLNFGADPHSPITNHYSGSPCTTYRLDSMNPRENLHVMEGGACFQRWVVCRLSVKQSTTERAFTLDAHLLHVLHQEYQPSAQKKKTAPTNRCS